MGQAKLDAIDADGIQAGKDLVILRKELELMKRVENAETGLERYKAESKLLNFQIENARKSLNNAKTPAEKFESQRSLEKLLEEKDNL